MDRTWRSSSKWARRSRTSCAASRDDSVYAERTATGRYIDVDIDAWPLRATGSTSRTTDIVASAVGGMNGELHGRGTRALPSTCVTRRTSRDSLEALRALPVVAPTGANIVLADVAAWTWPTAGDDPQRERAAVGLGVRGPAGRDLGGYVEDAKRRVAAELDLPAGYSLGWSGSTSTWSGRPSACRWSCRSPWPSSCCCCT